jgi:hypothetical protein
MRLGLYSRIAAAALTLLLSLPGQAATREHVSMPSAQSAATAANGVSSRAGSNLNVSSPFQQMLKKPVASVNVNKGWSFSVPKIAEGVKGRVLNPGSAGLAAAIAVAVAGVDWVMNEGTVSKPSGVAPYNVTYYHWGSGFLNYADAAPTPEQSCVLRNTKGGSRSGTYQHNGVVRRVADLNGQPMYQCQYWHTTSKQLLWDTTYHVTRRGSGCAPGYVYEFPSCMAPASPVTAQDVDQVLTPYLNAGGADFLRDILRDVCAGSSSPGRCFEDMADNPFLIGPSSVELSPKTTTSTTTNPDGSTSTQTKTDRTTLGLEYGPSHIDITTTTTSTTTNPDGSTSTETSTDAEPTPSEESQPDDQDEQEYTFEDSEFPDVEPFYDQKYPDGFQGVWESFQADIDNSEFVSFMNSFVPSFSGSCPAFGLNLNIASWANYGVHQFSSICYVLDFVKVCLLITALFCCRALIFGG